MVIKWKEAAICHLSMVTRNLSYLLKDRKSSQVNVASATVTENLHFF
jgi:hypothetical protein